MARRKSYARILEPGTIGRIRTRNRIIKSGAGMLMWHEDDVHMREEVQAHYERFARGGVGLVIVEAVTVDYPGGRATATATGSTRTGSSPGSPNWPTSSTGTIARPFSP